MSSVKITVVGLDKLKSELERYGEETLVAMGEALTMEANELMTASKRLVPVNTGNLRDSGYVAPVALDGTHATIELGYGGPAAPYALYVHENPRAGKTGGVSPSGKPYPRNKGGKPTWAETGEWKFLETPYKASLTGIAQRVADRVRARFGLK